MNMLKRIITFSLVAVFSLSMAVSAKTVEIKDSQIVSIEIPDQYNVCTLDSCEEGMLKLFERMGISYDGSTPGAQAVWMEDAKNSNICLYGMDENGNQITVQVWKIYDAGSDDSEEIHIEALTNDYNYILKKNDAIDQYTNSLGLLNTDFSSIEWVEREDLVTPYIKSSYSRSPYYIRDYTAIYNAHKIVVQFHDVKKSDAEKFALGGETFESIVYSTDVDYTKVKSAMNEKEVEQSEEMKEKDDTSTIILIGIGVLVLAAFFFAVYLATRKRRKNRTRND